MNVFTKYPTVNTVMNYQEKKNMTEKAITVLYMKFPLTKISKMTTQIKTTNACAKLTQQKGTEQQMNLCTKCV